MVAKPGGDGRYVLGVAAGMAATRGLSEIKEMRRIIERDGIAGAASSLRARAGVKSSSAETVVMAMAYRRRKRRARRRLAGVA